MSRPFFVSDPALFHNRTLASNAILNPSVAVDAQHGVVYRRPGFPPEVSIVTISGQGPVNGGAVGAGMLTAMAIGDFYAAPNAGQIHCMLTTKVAAAKGILCIVPTYSGDILNFGLAIERARAEGLEILIVSVGDDVSVGRSKLGKSQRRALAGQVLVQKIAGALAATGAGLEAMRKVSQLAANNVVTYGVKMGGVAVPGRDGMDDKSSRQKYDLGAGIGPDPGSDDAEIEDFPALVAHILKRLLDHHDPERGFLKVDSNEVVLMVNSLGGIGFSEMGAITTELVLQLEKDHDIKPIRIYTGSYMSAINCYGFSVTLLNIVNTDSGGSSMLDLLDAPSETNVWRQSIRR